jgi:uncharacterized protein
VLQQGFEALARHEVVVGPSTDGGYYLLGMKHLYPDLFRGKKWSTHRVLTDTLQDAARLEVSIHLLPLLTDVDEEKDLPTIYP